MRKKKKGRQKKKRIGKKVWDNRVRVRVLVCTTATGSASAFPLRLIALIASAPASLHNYRVHRIRLQIRLRIWISGTERILGQSLPPRSTGLRPLRSRCPAPPQPKSQTPASSQKQIGGERNEQKTLCVLRDFIPFRNYVLLPARQRVLLTIYCPWAALF